jgi:hypothetical protein
MSDSALDEPVGAGEGGFAQAHHGHAVHVLQPALDDADAEHVGHEEDAGRGALHLFQQLHDARLRTQRQRDVDLVHAVLARCRAPPRRRLPSRPALRASWSSAVVGAVVEDSPGSGRPDVTACLAQRPCHLHAQRAGTHHQRPSAGCVCGCWASWRRQLADPRRSRPATAATGVDDGPPQQNLRARTYFRLLRGVAAKRPGSPAALSHEVKMSSTSSMAADRVQQEAVAAREGQREDQQAQHVRSERTMGSSNQFRHRQEHQPP